MVSKCSVGNFQSRCWKLLGVMSEPYLRHISLYGMPVSSGEIEETLQGRCRKLLDLDGMVILQNFYSWLKAYHVKLEPLDSYDCRSGKSSRLDRTWRIQWVNSDQCRKTIITLMPPGLLEIKSTLHWKFRVSRPHQNRARSSLHGHQRIARHHLVFARCHAA